MPRGRPVIDMTGKEYGSLTVVDRANAKGAAEWNCKCACGNTVVLLGTLLRKGNVVNCGSCPTNTTTEE